jgi:hypothetical protein
MVPAQLQLVKSNQTLSDWSGLFIGWIIGSIITAIALMLFAAAKRDDFLYNAVINDWGREGIEGSSLNQVLKSIT